MNSPFLKEVQYICTLLSDTFHLPVAYYDENDKLLFTFGALPLSNPFKSSKSALLEQLHTAPSGSGLSLPVITSSFYIENYLSLRIDISESMLGTVLIGPCLYRTAKDETIKGLKNDFQLTTNEEKLKDYFSSLPIISKSTLLHIGKMACYLFQHRKIDILDITELQNTSDEYQIDIENTELRISENRQTKTFHPPYLHEKEMLRCITEGNKEEFFRKVQSLAELGELGVLSKRSHMRSYKNLAVSGITLATRAALEGGLEQEIAYTLSDIYIQAVEEAESTAQVERIQAKAFGEMADRVKNVKQKKYSKPVNDCTAHIFKHLYEDIPLSELAELTSLSPSYLSKLFKKETGISLSTFIQIERIEEAKKLLIFSNYSLTDIYTMLNFNDQSYFTKVFKTVTGVTPKEYKARH